jgi:hypothetical protein
METKTKQYIIEKTITGFTIHHKRNIKEDITYLKNQLENVPGVAKVETYKYRFFVEIGKCFDTDEVIKDIESEFKKIA